MMRSPLIIAASAILTAANLIGLVNLMGPLYFPSSFQNTRTISTSPKQSRIPNPRSLEIPEKTIFLDEKLLKKVFSTSDPLFLLIKNGKLKEAEAELSKLEKKREKEINFLTVYAKLLQANGNNFEALKRYHLLVKRYPKNMDFRLSRAKLFSIFLRFNEAIKDITYVLEHQPDNKEATDILVLFKKAQTYDENLIKKMKNNLHRSVLLEQAKVFETKKLFRSAIKNYLEIIQLNENDIETKIFLAKARNLSNDTQSPFKNYFNLRKDYPNNIKVLLSEAAFLMNANKYKSAYTNFKKVLVLSPQNKSAKAGLKRLVERIKSDIGKFDKKEKLTSSPSIKNPKVKTLALKNRSIKKSVRKKDIKPFIRKSDLLYQKIRDLQSQNRLEEALFLTEKLINQALENSAYLNLRGVILLALGKADEAELTFRQSLKIDPANKIAANTIEQIKISQRKTASKKMQNERTLFIENKMKLARKTGDDKESAITLYREILMRYPDETNIALELARALKRTDKFEEAKKLYLQLNKMNPKNIDVLLELGILFLNKGQLDNAEKNIQSAHSLNPNHPEIQKAIQSIKKRKFNIQKNRAIAESWEEAAKLFQKNSAKKAIQTLKDILKVYPSEPATLLQLGKMYQKSGSPEKAIKIFSQLTEQFPSNIDFLRLQALTYIDLKKEKKAKAILLKAQMLAPKNQKVKNILSLMQNKNDMKSLNKDMANWEILGQYHAIIKRLEQEIKNHPANANLQFMLAQSQSSAGRMEDAVATYDRLLQKYPDNFDYLLGRGLALNRLNQSARAKKDLMLALEIKPKNTDVQIGLGNTLVKERHFLAGAKQFEDVLKNDPDNPEALVSLREIENLTSDRLVQNIFIEKFSNRSSRLNSFTELIHPFTSRFRGRIGAVTLNTNETLDVSGFLGGNWDATPNWNVGVRAGITPSADLLPEYFHEEEINYLFSQTDVKLSVLYRYMNFESDPFHFLIPGVTYRILDNLTTTARAYLGFQKQGNTHAGQLKLDYNWNPELSTYVSGVYGDGGSRITTNQERTPANVYSIQSGFQYRFSKTLAVGFNHEYENRKGQFKRNIFSIDFPFWF